MDYEIKKQIYSFITSHNDGSEQCEALIRVMKTELNYADIGCCSLSIDDLELYKHKLFGILHKDIKEPITIKDCVTVANAMDSLMADEMSETISNAIDYELSNRV